MTAPRLLAALSLSIALGLTASPAQAQETQDQETQARGQGAEPAKAEAGRWAADMERFAKADEEKPFPKGGVVFVGSSSIRMWKLGDSFPDLGALNRGFGGSEVSDSVEHADLLAIKHAPRAILMYAGDNDIAKGKSAERVLADYQKFVAKVRAELPGARLVYIAIKPSRKRWNLWPEMEKANNLIKEFSEKGEGLAFADIAAPMLKASQPPPEDLFLDDGLHLSAKGYAMWKEVIAPLIDPKGDQ
ncbi:MAG: GDSL-type esterase/lipase family protein [Verrucomicrobiales bacterium]